jgi:hypothetical protein
MAQQKYPEITFHFTSELHWKEKPPTFVGG